MCNIVPCWKNEERIDCFSSFLDFVKNLPGEKVLHGYAHHRKGNSLWNRFWFGGLDHAEFDFLNRAEAGERIRKGVAVFKNSFGRQPDWFCAPRWRQGPGTVEALRVLDFFGYMAENGYHFFSAESIEIPALCFDVGNFRCKTVVNLRLQMIRLGFWIRRRRGFRLALHPSDTTRKFVLQAIRAVFKRLERSAYKPANLEDIAPVPRCR